jgi:two-component system response regulator AtoC
VRLKNSLPSSELSDSGLDRLVGESRCMKELKNLIRKYAALDLPVLILGETGTGKELTARALHEHSSRSQGPFITVNCSAIAENLLESELFGYEKGAFSGAFQKKPGLISQAQGGILFLDEIGDLSSGLQAKLLRVLQFQTFIPVGGVKEIQADFRVICATNRNLAEMVEEGTFRRDLFYRINTLPVFLEPLRRHPEDIPLLVERLGAIHRLGLPSFDPEALKLLQDYDFPGNVRELEGCLWKLHAHYPYHEPGVISADFLTGILPELDRPAGIPGLPGEKATSPPENLDLNEVILNMELQIIEEAYMKNDKNITKTAKALNLSRQGLKNKLKRHDLIP